MRRRTLTLRAFLAILALSAFMPDGATADIPKPAEAPTASLHAVPLPATPDELIPRRILLAFPDRSRPRLSPDGLSIAYLAPVEGVLNIWVAPADDPLAARPLTSESARGIKRYLWAFTSNHIIYFRESRDGIAWRVVAVEVAGGKEIDLTPHDAIQPYLFATSSLRPNDAVIGINNRLPDVRDLYTVDIRDGRRTLLRTGSPAIAGWVIDQSLRPRYGISYRPDGSQALLNASDEGHGEPVIEFPYEDALTSWPIGFADDNRILHLADSRARETSALVAFDTLTAQARTIAQDERCDLEEASINPRHGRVDAACFRGLRRRWVALDPALQPDLDYLARLSDGEMEIASRALDDSRWLVQFSDDDGPDLTFLYQRGVEPSARLLFVSSDALADVPLAPMHAVTLRARDGLALPSYLTLPRWAGPPDARLLAPDDPRRATPVPLPLVLLVHGGPWARDSWGFNSVHQLLANRGYAVLSVNFRGSTGFGKSFVNASTGEWGKAMQTDLLDAVAWAVDTGIADPARIAIMGGSYGGYTVLRALTTTPDTFACGVELCGTPSLLTLLRSVPPDRRAAATLFRSRVGNPDTPAGEATLLELSPLTHANRIRRPLLAVHGGKDPWSRPAEVEQLLDAAEANGATVTYAVFPEEGHSLARAENVAAYFAMVEAFLARHLGGRAEPIDAALDNSTAEVRRGREHIGLPAK